MSVPAHVSGWIVLRAWLISPVLLAVSLGAVLLVNRAGHLHLSVIELYAATAVVAAAAELSVIPLQLTRGADQAAVSQAGLVSTVLHLMVCAAAGWAVASVFHFGSSFTYAVLGFYWVALIGVSMNAIWAIRSAPIHRPTVTP